MTKAWEWPRGWQLPSRLGWPQLASAGISLYRGSPVLDFIHVQSNPADTRLIRTPHYYKQFALSLGKESPYIFQLIQPAHMDTPLIGKRFMAPSVTGFDCSSDQPLIKTFCSIPSVGVSLTGENRLL